MELLADDETDLQAIEAARNALSEARKYSPGCSKHKSKQTLKAFDRSASAARRLTGYDDLPKLEHVLKEAISDRE